MKLFIIFGILVAVTSGQDYVEGEYLIRLKDNTLQTTEQEVAFTNLLASDFNVKLNKLFRLGDVQILHVEASADDIARVGLLEEILNIGPNGYVYAAQSCYVYSSPGTWALDRLDQVAILPYSSPTEPSATYEYGAYPAPDVRAYILDTGLDILHSDFGGRALWGYVAEGVTDTDPGDVLGHGTAVAGIIGSNSYGVAKEVALVSVKVLNDDGTGVWSSVIDGMAWVRTEDINRTPRSVVNLSVSGNTVNLQVEAAIDALVLAGIVVVGSAGNDDTTACNHTPGFVSVALTVGASDVTDKLASNTNWGACVDLFAPGIDVLSTWPGEATQLFSGTSAAAASVSGCAARYMSSRVTAPLPSTVFSWITTQATRDALTIPPPQESGTTNRLIYCPCQL